MNTRIDSTRSESPLSSSAALEYSILTEFSRSLPVVPVVIDPILARRLRPHQVEGQLAYSVHWYSRPVLNRSQVSSLCMIVSWGSESTRVKDASLRMKCKPSSHNALPILTASVD